MLDDFFETWYNILVTERMHKIPYITMADRAVANVAPANALNVDNART